MQTKEGKKRQQQIKSRKDADGYFGGGRGKRPRSFYTTMVLPSPSFFSLSPSFPPGPPRTSELGPIATGLKNLWCRPSPRADKKNSFRTFHLKYAWRAAINVCELTDMTATVHQVMIFLRIFIDEQSDLPIPPSFRP